MSIIGTLPNNLTNGTTADASQVMADFNFIVNQVNANANPIGTLTAPSGTRAVFQQATAPTGWTVDSSASLTDCAMRFNQTVGTGGTTAWSGWNNGNAINCNAIMLSVGNLPAHSHTINDPTHTHSVNDPTHFHSFSMSNAGLGSTGSPAGSNNGSPYTATTNAASTGISLVANNTGITINNTGSGTAFTPSFTTPSVKYADCVVGVKS